MDSSARYVMMRVSDDRPELRFPDLLRRRTKTLCDRCREACWLDPKSVQPIPAHVPRICIQCLQAERQ